MEKKQRGGQRGETVGVKEVMVEGIREDGVI